MKKSCRKNRFTLLELLLVAAVLFTLPLLLVAIVPASREQGKMTGCQDNLKKLGTAMLSYAEANNGYGPLAYTFTPTIVSGSLAAHFGVELDKNLYYKDRITAVECPAATCNGEKVTYSAGIVRKGRDGWSGIGFSLDYTVAFGTGTSKAYGNHGFNYFGGKRVDNLIVSRALNNTRHLGQKKVDLGRGRKADYYEPADQVMAGDMEAISFDGKNIQSTYAGHAPKNNSLPHGNAGVNLVFMDGHAVWRNFADCTRDIEYFSSKGDNVKNGIRW